MSSTDERLVRPEDASSANERPLRLSSSKAPRHYRIVSEQIGNAVGLDLDASEIGKAFWSVLDWAGNCFRKVEVEQVRGRGSFTVGLRCAITRPASS